VTTLASGFDGAIRRINRTYDNWGRVEKVRSYDNAAVGSGTIQNEVKNTYDGWGNLTKYEQNHSGEVTGSGTYDVEYAYEKKAATGGVRATIRRTTMTLPNGQALSNIYSSAGNVHDDDASRVTFVREGANNRARYWYLGSSRLVGTTYREPSTDVASHLFDGSDVFDGLDQFNRTIISRWKQGSTNLYSVALTYDRNSNVLTVDDAVQTGFDWKYTYDDLDRLVRAQRGTLSGGSISSETGDQNWTLDHAGNWDNTTYDLNADDVYTGTNEYDWNFIQNKANELTSWDDQSTTVTPTYDAAGNLADDKRDWKYVYDAFYRLVTVKNQSDTVTAEFKYNGVGHRISARYNTTAPWYHFAYDERWRIVEMYEDTDTAPTEQFWNHNAGLSGFGGSSYIDDVILRLRDTNGDGTLDERRYCLQNWHHDVVALIDNTGSIIERANYTAYGTPIGTFSSINNRKGYAGYEYDPTLGQLYHVRNRVLRSDVGLWLHRDALSSDLIDLYGYVRSNPISGVDPMGQELRLIACPNSTVWNLYASCGEVHCLIGFEYAGSVSQRHYIVQLVDYGGVCQDCDDNSDAFSNSPGWWEYIDTIPANTYNWVSQRCDHKSLPSLADCIGVRRGITGKFKAVPSSSLASVTIPKTQAGATQRNARGTCCGGLQALNGKWFDPPNSSFFFSAPGQPLRHHCASSHDCCTCRDVATGCFTTSGAECWPGEKPVCGTWPPPGGVF
jgi:RHS repeat-associated protein